MRRSHPCLPSLVVCLAALAACTAEPPREGVYLARNDLRVVPFAPDRFEVLARAGTAGPDYFCAAGDFAQRFLNAGATDRVVVVEPSGPSRFNPGGRGMVFRVAPAGSVRPSGGITVRTGRAGENRTVAHARALCEVRRERNDPRVL